MQFQANPYPVVGDTRTRIRFALVPIRVHGDKIIWLESYTQHETYILDDGGHDCYETKYWTITGKYAN